MVRPSRIEVEGGWYQVVNRGIVRRSIFKKQRSYAHFLELPAKMPERFELKVHRYVLMRNHSEFITILCRWSDTPSVVHYENDSCPNAKCFQHRPLRP